MTPAARAAEPSYRYMQMRALVAGALLRPIVIGLIAFLTLVDLLATQVILPSLAHAYDVSPAACYFLGGLVGTAILGQVFDRLGWAACVAGIAASLAVAALLAVRLIVPGTQAAPAQTA